ncbi:uncharacterized protein LOC126784657 isoform X2 [Argentina anserina]|uniref:uncharacterized protein LOC126784657 isoform X2 n=1 Tax=Argentina anserina TaxID=57926 RepID=UPI0021767B50|nr:uncharacterized protein LOC126784657 isoform X2 [Potentilla anserina]
MDDSPPQKSPATPKRRTSRRLVQSTLFPVKPPEPVENGDLKSEEKNEQDEEVGGSQSKRKRKPAAAAKKTPPVKAPKKSGKRSANSTPTKKNGKDVLVEDGPLIMPDLRLEAKLRGAEISRIWTKEGRQIHPFFACSKAAKKSQEVIEVEGSSSFIGSKETYITCGPIHVFENTQDDAVFLDWRNWTFCEETSPTSSLHLECTPSILNGSAECLSSNKVSSVSQPCIVSTFQDTASLDQRRIQQECAHETSSEQVRCYEHSKEVGDCEVEIIYEHTGCMKKSEIEQQNTFLEERPVSSNLGCCDQYENSLWTYKYQPKNSTEVCGNNESVKFLSEWLRSWYELDPQTSEDGDMQSIDYNCTQSDSESEDDEVLKIKNVLLVTGPIGSGKSAAIYACAKEQGIKVLELSASECRSGSQVNKRFGEAFKSRKFQRSVAKTVGSQNKLIMKSRFLGANGMTGQDLDDDDVVELIPISDEECQDATGSSITCAFKEECSKDKLVILFEDVDITFEDRGFISAVQQIAKTANGPIILTSNSPKPELPDSFDRLQVHFMLPSSAELYSHARMVCASEKTSIQPDLLERFIECCGGDIRKVIMHLQFWCQGRSFRKDTKMMRETYDLLLFDVDTGHQMLPKLLPWDLPSQLSDLVEKEITKSLSMMEEDSMEVDDNTEVHCSLNMAYSEMENIEAKKVAMLSRNGDTPDCSEFITTDTATDFSNDSGTSFPFPRRNVRRMHGVVLSSDSEDDSMKNGKATVTDRDSNHEVSGVDSLSEMLLFPGVMNIDRGLYDCLIADEFNTSEMCNVADISRVPESSFVPETQMDSETDFLSQTMSSGHFVSSINKVFLGDELPVEDRYATDLLSQTVSSGHFANTMNEVHFEVLPVEDKNPAQCKSESQINFDKMGNNCDAIPEYSHQELEDSQSEHVETEKAYQLMDECSRVDFNNQFQFIQEQKTLAVSDLVQDSWNKLRGQRNDLRQYVASEQRASQIVTLAYRMSDMISETDIMFSKCKPLMNDFVEPSKISVESDSFSWCDEQLLLASTIAHHGFCFYAKGISSVGSNVGCTRVDVDIASEMLANTNNMMALGQLVGQGMRTIKISYAGRNTEIHQPKVITSEIKSRVFDAVQSIVPSKFKSTLRGSAYIEYLSSLRHISRSEASRLSKGVENTTRRRKRVAPHYLSSGARMLSPEQLSLLDQYNLCGKTTTSSM